MLSTHKLLDGCSNGVQGPTEARLHSHRCRNDAEPASVLYRSPCQAPTDAGLGVCPQLLVSWHKKVLTVAIRGMSSTCQLLIAPCKMQLSVAALKQLTTAFSRLKHVDSVPRRCFSRLQDTHNSSEGGC